MRFNIEIDWALVLKKIRIFFLLGIFFLLYDYFDVPVWAFIWIFYFFLSDVADMESDIDTIKVQQEQREKDLKNLMPKRKNF